MKTGTACENSTGRGTASSKPVPKLYLSFSFYSLIEILFIKINKLSARVGFFPNQNKIPKG